MDTPAERDDETSRAPPDDVPHLVPDDQGEVEMEGPPRQSGIPHSTDRLNDPPVAADDFSRLWEDTRRRVVELKSYAQYYISAKRDAIKAKIVRASLWVIAGIVAMVAGLCVLATAVALLLGSIADLISGAVGRSWAGGMIVGGGLLLIIALGLWLGPKLFVKALRKATVKKYEEIRRKQRSDFGHDVHERADEKAHVPRG